MATVPKHTLYAARGLEFVAQFQVRFMAMDVSGHQPRLRPPPGESTAGGKLATQHIVLESNDASAPVWTVGSVNVATMGAKLRTYDCVRALHRARFKDRAFPLDRDLYQSFFDSAATFMKERGVAAEVESAPPEIALQPEPMHGSRESIPTQGRVSLVWVIVIAIGLALGAAAVVFFLLRNFSH